ncbi:MAG: S8 family serine peptidase, partial [Candidatus Eremiobacteraeota bacterium]|nr:S8 family serine peptidase [Candidatus Eremiobacteraeota bacterium]
MSSKLGAALACALALSALASTADARPYRRPAAITPDPVSHRVAFMGYLHDARVATVYTDGRVVIAPPHTAPPATPAERRAALLRAMHGGTRTMQTRLPLTRYGPLDGDVAADVRRRILFDLEHPPQRYAPARVLVVFKPNVTMGQDADALSPSSAFALRRNLLAHNAALTPHAFTNDQRTNLTLMQLGVDRAERLFAQADRGTLGALRARAEARTRRSLVAFDNAYALHVGASSVEQAVRTLRADPNVAYAAPDYAVSSMLAERRAVPAEAVKEVAGFHRATHTFGRATRGVGAALPSLPTNSAIGVSLQAMLNAPGVDAVAAFDEIAQRFGQLPGTGEIITNIGLGDVTDSSEATNTNDPCAASAAAEPTTHLIGGQHYLDVPSMPLIPVWVSDANGTLSPNAAVCGVDPSLGEVGLDFSVMAPLPDNLQRGGETAPVGIDLLGIAPGASFRWVAPGTANGVSGTSEILGAMLGAARQVPAPNVITASLGFGADSFGFPSRYLEDDPLAQSVVASIVASNIVVCIAANDGTRTLTTAAIGPSGGSAATNVGTTGTTTLDDIDFTTAPSVVPDSGAIDVGATTLDDVLAANPADPASGPLGNTQAFAETRYDGTLGFSSGFGTRVNISAPGDNISALALTGSSYDAVSLQNVGGTSASAPEVAAAAAVALQVARLTGHPYASATQVR